MARTTSSFPVPDSPSTSMPWQHTWGSGRFSGVAVDADYVADGIQRRLGEKAVPRRPAVNALALGT